MRGESLGCAPRKQTKMVIVAQLVEPRIVIPVVAGSSPVIHPILFSLKNSLNAFTLKG